MRVEYKLDPWEWQGVTHSIDIDPEDYAGMSAEDILYAIRRDIHEDAASNLHLVYAENEAVREILAALQSKKANESEK